MEHANALIETTSAESLKPGFMKALVFHGPHNIRLEALHSETRTRRGCDPGNAHHHLRQRCAHHKPTRRSVSWKLSS